MEIVEVPDGGNRFLLVEVNEYITLFRPVTAFAWVIVLNGHFTVWQYSCALVEILVGLFSITTFDKLRVPQIVKDDTFVGDGTNEIVLACVVKEVHLAVFRNGSFLSTRNGNGFVGCVDGSCDNLVAAKDACNAYGVRSSINDAKRP